ncbi:hypothetical protein Tco_0693421 [Tanacetum coccineum]
MTTLVPCEDRYIWTLESDGVFSVASIRKKIDGNRFQDVSLPTRWVKSVPINGEYHRLGKFKSNELQRVLISLVWMDIDSIVLSICNVGVESYKPYFLSMRCRECELVVSIRIQSKLKGVLEGVYYGLWWYMWNFRNKLLFDKKIPEKALIFDNLVSSSFYL